MSRYCLFSVILSLFLSINLRSQTDTSYILPQLKIYMKEDGKKVTYTFEEYDYNKFTVKNNFLIADTHRYNFKTDVNNIRKVSFRDGNNGWTLAGYGAGLGFILGFFAGGYFTIDGPVKFNIKNAIPVGLIFAVPVGLIGGLIGMLSPAYDEYELSKVDPGYKPVLLKKILKKKKLNTF